MKTGDIAVIAANDQKAGSQPFTRPECNGPLIKFSKVIFRSSPFDRPCVFSEKPD